MNPWLWLPQFCSLDLFFRTLIFTLHWEILIMLLSQFQLTLCRTQKGYVSFHRIAYEYYHTDWDSLRDYLRGFPCPCFCCCYWILLVGIDFIRLELLIISVIVNISSSLTHFHGFQLLVLPELIEIAIFVCTNNTFCESKVKFRQQVIVAKAFL